MNYIFNKYAILAVTMILTVGAFGMPVHAQYYNGAPTYNQPVYNTPVNYSQPNYNQSNYYNQPTYYAPLTVSCSANTYNVAPGASVTWTAYASGGNGYYTYSWSGSDGIYGSNRSAYITYNYPGQKSASVTIYSNGQTLTQYCSNTVTVNYSYGTYPTSYQTPYPTNYYPTTYPVVNQPIYAVPNNSGLDIGCYSDPMTATIGQPVTWSVEVVGGIAPYTYAWTGSDGLSGSQISVIKYYSTSGTKSAIVTVTSADGKTASHACSNALKVASAYRAPVARAVAPVKTIYVQPAVQSQPQSVQIPANASISAVSLFSLYNVPWGWIAILIILVLFFTVMYLLFNKQKI